MKRVSLLLIFINLLVFYNRKLHSKEEIIREKTIKAPFESNLFSFDNYFKNEIDNKHFFNFKEKNELKMVIPVYNNKPLYNEKNQNAILNIRDTPSFSQGQPTIKFYEILTSRFNGNENPGSVRNQMNHVIDAFEEIQKHIGVHLYNKEYISYIGETNLVAQKITDDIYATLVLDYPDVIKNIAPSQVKFWKKPVDSLFEIGIANIKEKYFFDLVENKINGHNLYTIDKSHFFVPNIIFDMKNKKDLIGEKGTLIGLPTRHNAMIYPINHSNIHDSIKNMLSSIKIINEKGPGSLSTNLFWYKSQKLIELKYTLKDGELNFHSSDEFTKMFEEIVIS